MSAFPGSSARPPAALPRWHEAGERVSGLDFRELESRLDEQGFVVIGSLLSGEECLSLAASYSSAALFRSRIVMDRHGFGRGEYQYFAYPLPEPVAALRRALYIPLARIANRWSASLKTESDFPATHAAYLRRCHDAGQTRPTPLLLQYTAGDYNCLHQDLYGELVFPLQVTILLSDPVTEFSGGELVLTEQRPRMQSRVSVVPLARGDAAIFPVRYRPVHGARGTYRVNVRHGVSRLRSGRRYTLGIIMHDAR
jgi:hypothetical protein